MIPKDLLVDVDALKMRGFDIEHVEKDGKIYLEFKKFPVPDGIYRVKETNLLIFTGPHYPYTSFDMFWTDPSLVMNDGSAPKQAEVREMHLGKEWRRFSYHPYQNVAWNPSDDNLAKYVAYVQQRLENGD